MDQSIHRIIDAIRMDVDAPGFATNERLHPLPGQGGLQVIQQYGFEMPPHPWGLEAQFSIPDQDHVHTSLIAPVIKNLYQSKY
jgi:hypothetical protein